MWTIVPASLLWDGFGESSPRWVEVEHEGVTMLVVPQGDGFARLERLISPRPGDYLRPEWQPGARISLAGKSRL
ncbi:YlzJ-like family protein [Alicyclobacillus cellulosilyticus]|nr:YlzJ-like family protein [Alicyclobacillus cellulosilyticus]